MKKIVIIAVATLALLSCKKEAKQTSTLVSTEVKKDKPVAEAKKVTLKIEGMTCAMGCAKVIENKLAGLDGVQKPQLILIKKKLLLNTMDRHKQLKHFQKQ